MKNLLPLKSLLSFALLVCSTNISANKIISVSDFGLKPDSRINAVPFVQKAINACKQHPGSTLVFPKGRYDFWAQHAIERDYHETNTYDVNPKILAVLLDQVNNLTIDGNGSEFIMHGRMQPCTLDRCQNITLKNFSVDWEIPLTAQGTVTQSTPDYIEVEIDTIENKRLTFVGEGWKSGLWSIMQFDPETHFVLPNTGDNLGWRPYDATEVKPGLVRLADPKREANKRFPAPGTILVLRHSTRDHAGIFIYHSTDTKLENLKLFHTCGLGILSQYSKNIAFNDVHIIPNAAKGRVLSGHDDGFHFMGCSGLLKIENCSWAGLMDDPINIHGTCSRIMEVLSPTRIKCKFMQDMSEGMEWGRPDEMIGFIEHNTMRTVATGKMNKFEALNKAEFIIELSAPLPTGVEAGYVIENLTCTPDAEIRNCHFGSCRARGLLVSTPGKVVIENNIFESSGSAILIAGDANAWYESGAVKDVLIRNNTFHLFDYPILFARSVDGLTFSDNTLIRDTTYQPYHYRKEGITLEACKSVVISNNKIEGDVLGRTVKFDRMKSSDIKISKNPFFRKLK